MGKNHIYIYIHIYTHIYVRDSIYTTHSCMWELYGIIWTVTILKLCFAVQDSVIKQNYENIHMSK